MKNLKFKKRFKQVKKSNEHSVLVKFIENVFILKSILNISTYKQSLF